MKRWRLECPEGAGGRRMSEIRDLRCGLSAAVDCPAMQNMRDDGYSEKELFRGFMLDRILNEDPLTKTVSLLGKFRDQKAIFIAEKSAFNVDSGILSSLPATAFTPNLRVVQRNDIYHWYIISSSSGQPEMKTTIIFPATDVHVRKYEKQKRHMIRETPEMYKELIEPYIQSMKGSRIQWLYNVLEHKAEVERILYEDPDPLTGFMLLPDLYGLSSASDSRKWDGTTMSALYLTAILHRKDLGSIRDLNASHIPLLTKIRQSIIKATTSRWPEVSPDQLRLYFHYHPSYYHMHIHVVHTDFNGSDGMAVGKAWLLDEIIEQLSYLGPEGFMTRTLTVIIGEETDIWKKVYSKLLPPN